MNKKDMKKRLKSDLKPSRYEHTLGVEYTSACLAMRYGYDVEKADLAGLLHDCAKHLSDKEKFALCKRKKIKISSAEKKNPGLLHAKLGAVLAKDKYDIKDKEILSAITWHTTGKPEMSLLDKIVFIADYIEPNRDQAPNLDEIRQMAFTDLDQCLIMILKQTLDYLESKDACMDPMTMETYQYYIK
ncbi:MAG: bis(5'-nucleosyl)-tetraphosphatase (symmetrical) YqeK [Lachnospiraceae bacterium]|nr:bis(5'-nucleosyl)-tetraphosphatase (symmetrical) YqeK [Lachnospiraceae bacterium]